MSTPEITRAEESGTVEAPERDLADVEYYFNRELSWLDFNDRVLQLAEDPDVPLLERVKFAAIYTSNLDEFFMVRVAGLQDQVEAGVSTRLQDGRTPSETIDAIRERVIEMSGRLYECLSGSLVPALSEHGICIVSYDRVSDEERASLSVGENGGGGALVTLRLPV